MTFLSIIAVFLMSTLPGGVPVHRCDVVEVNRVLNDDGSIGLEQVIWWDWCGSCGRYEVRDWRLLSKCAIPRRVGSNWRTEWTDSGTQRAVVSGQYLRTETNWDRELNDRTNLAEDKRRKIR